MHIFVWQTLLLLKKIWSFSKLNHVIFKNWWKKTQSNANYTKFCSDCCNRFPRKDSRVILKASKLVSQSNINMFVHCNRQSRLSNPNSRVCKNTLHDIDLHKHKHWSCSRRQWSGNWLCWVWKKKWVWYDLLYKM